MLPPWVRWWRAWYWGRARRSVLPWSIGWHFVGVLIAVAAVTMGLIALM